MRGKGVLMETSTIDADDDVRGFKKGGLSLEVFDVFVFGLCHWRRVIREEGRRKEGSQVVE